MTRQSCSEFIHSQFDSETDIIKVENTEEEVKLEQVIETPDSEESPLR